MKLSFFVCMIVLTGVAGLQAQEPQPSPAEGGKPGQMPRNKPHDRRDQLPPEVRERFDAARKKALEDPGIQALRSNAEKANQEFFGAMRKKMLEIDPGLADVVKDKLKDKPGHGWQGGFDKEKGLDSLTEGERQRLMAARTVANNDPAVQAAEQKKNAAQNPEERMAAMKEYRKAMDEAILKADPTLAPVLEKIKPSKRGRPGPKPGAPAAPPQ